LGAGAHVGRGTLVLLFKQACVNLFKSDRRMPHRRRTQPQNGDDRGRRTKDGGWWMVNRVDGGWGTAWMVAEGHGRQDAGRRTVGVSFTNKSLLD